ncbi:hypothetical protein V5799_011770 [Amblyomma americanum]|uniref:Dynamin N-terminal domain-containing protein n=1 Tax=Amblyomma americanum TaxID=6943 RepID=A0AAQ4EGC5_AMBAM
MEARSISALYSSRLLLLSAADGIQTSNVRNGCAGLVKVAESLGQTLLPPRKKIVVLLIGNHSAGKSTFINWYIEEHVQKTGVAIETQGFALVTSGKKRESLTGNATLHLYPHFKPLQKIKGVVDYLTTEISTSRQKRFSLVTFIDTPGLVDGDMKYPYDVNKTILWLGECCLTYFECMASMKNVYCFVQEKEKFVFIERYLIAAPMQI